MEHIFQLFKKIAAEKRPSSPVSYLVAGLGNPGVKYAKTRHNAGFLALEYIAQKELFQIKKCKFKSLCAEGNIEGRRVLFLLPQTYMNRSGEALREAAAFHRIPIENVIVLFDDISLPPGKIRIRKKGSDGGHNGIKSILYHIGSDHFTRIKIGIGDRTHPETDLADWVLSRFDDAEKDQLFRALEMAHDSVRLIVSGQTEKAMNLYN